jgi:hypothetical protein
MVQVGTKWGSKKLLEKALTDNEWKRLVESAFGQPSTVSLSTLIKKIAQSSIIPVLVFESNDAMNWYTIVDAVKKELTVAGLFTMNPDSKLVKQRISINLSDDDVDRLLQALLSKITNPKDPRDYAEATMRGHLRELLQLRFQRDMAAFLNGSFIAASNKAREIMTLQAEYAAGITMDAATTVSGTVMAMVPGAGQPDKRSKATIVRIAATCRTRLRATSFLKVTQM